MGDEEYDVIWSKNAEKEFAKLPSNIRDQLQPIINGLNHWYDLPNLSKVRLRKNAFRVRKGDYRIGFLVNLKNHKVSIAKIGKKDKFYD